MRYCRNCRYELLINYRRGCLKTTEYNDLDCRLEIKLCNIKNWNNNCFDYKRKFWKFWIKDK